MFKIPKTFYVPKNVEKEKVEISKVELSDLTHLNMQNAEQKKEEQQHLIYLDQVKC